MECKECKSNFRTIKIPDDKDRICYKCNYNNGKNKTIKLILMNIERKLKLMEDTFRGLWKSREVDREGNVSDTKWSVTFIYKGDYTETPYYSTAHEALDHAINLYEVKNE